MQDTNRNIRLPEFVSLDVTYRCNLRCVHCYNNSGERELCELGRDELIGTAWQIVELQPFNLCICGGEPLCCPWLEDVLSIFKGRIPRINMVTNGYAMTEKLAGKLREYGVSAVQISLDGAYAWQHDTLRGVPGAFERALSALSLLKNAGFSQLYTSILPTVLNAGSLEEYIRLCLSVGVSRVRSMPFLAAGRGSGVGRALMLDDAGYFYYKRELARLRRLYGEQIVIEWDDPLANIIPPERGMPKNISLFADGSIAASVYLPVTLGNTRRHTLSEYWFGGYCGAWNDPRLKEYISPLTNLSGLDELAPPPHGGGRIELDILEDRP